LGEAGLVCAAAAEGPCADRADVDVDELADGVVAHAAFVQAERDVAELAGGDAGDADVDGLGQGVLRVPCDTGVGAAGAEVFVGFGSAVAADDVHHGVGPAEPGEEVVEQVEFAGVVVALVVVAVVAEEVVELGERGGQVGVADTVNNVEAFAGVQVVELEVVLLAGERGCIAGRTHFAGSKGDGGAGRNCDGCAGESEQRDGSGVPARTLVKCRCFRCLAVLGGGLVEYQIFLRWEGPRILREVESNCRIAIAFFHSNGDGRKKLSGRL